MTNRYALGVVLVAAVIAAAATGCTGNDGTSTSTESAGSPSEVATTTPSPSPAATTTSEAASPTPTGQPIGTATMRVGGSGQATIRYQINGAAEQTESNVALPWELEYPVYSEVQSSVSADAGDAELTCSIIMDGQLAAFKTEPRPTCSFAHYG